MSSSAPVLGVADSGFPGRVRHTGANPSDKDLQGYGYEGDWFKISVDQTDLYPGDLHGPTDYRLFTTDKSTGTPLKGFNLGVQPIPIGSFVEAWPIGGSWGLLPKATPFESYYAVAEMDETLLVTSQSETRENDGDSAFSELDLRADRDAYNFDGTYTENFWPAFGEDLTTGFETTPTIKTPGNFAFWVSLMLDMTAISATTTEWINFVCNLSILEDGSATAIPQTDVNRDAPATSAQHWPVGYCSLQSVGQRGNISAAGLFNISINRAFPFTLRLSVAIDDHSTTGFSNVSYAVRDCQLIVAGANAYQNAGEAWIADTSGGVQPGPGEGPVEPPPV